MFTLKVSSLRDLTEVSNMAQWIKHLLNKPDNLSSIPGEK